MVIINIFVVVVDLSTIRAVANTLQKDKNL